MEQIYSTGSKVYVQCTVDSADVSTTDVSYTLSTYRAKFRGSQVNDIFKRTPDDMKEEILTECTEEVRATDFEYFKNLLAMTEDQIKSCFGTTYTTLSAVLEGYTPDEIISKFTTWNTSLNIVVGDIVKFTANSKKGVVLRSVVSDGTVVFDVFNPTDMTVTAVKLSDNLISNTGSYIDVSTSTISQITTAVANAS